MQVIHGARADMRGSGVISYDSCMTYTKGRMSITGGNRGTFRLVRLTLFIVLWLGEAFKSRFSLCMIDANYGSAPMRIHETAM